jgi:transposase
MRFVSQRSEKHQTVSALHASSRSRRLVGIPWIGPITASALALERGDARQFANARQFSAALGLVPRQYSTGGKPTLLGISKRGDRNLRRLLVQCARSWAVLARGTHCQARPLAA